MSGLLGRKSLYALSDLLDRNADVIRLRSLYSTVRSVVLLSQVQPALSEARSAHRQEDQ